MCLYLILFLTLVQAACPAVRWLQPCALSCLLATAAREHWCEEGLFWGENDTSEKQQFQYNTLQPKGHHRDRDIVFIVIKGGACMQSVPAGAAQVQGLYLLLAASSPDKGPEVSKNVTEGVWGHLPNNKAVVQTRSGNTKLVYWLLFSSKYYYYFLNKWFINDKALWSCSMYLYCLCASWLVINVTKKPVTKLAGEWAAQLVKPVGDSGKSSQVTTWLEASRYSLEVSASVPAASRQCKKSLKEENQTLKRQETTTINLRWLPQNGIKYV